MKAPAEIRGAISERVMGSRMVLLCPSPPPSTTDQRPLRERALNEAADDVPARAASSARVRAGPDARPEPPDFPAPPELLRPPVEAAPLEERAEPAPLRRRPPPLPGGCSTTGAGSTYGAARPTNAVVSR